VANVKRRSGTPPSSAATRGRLIDAARHVLATEGIRAATIRRIAAVAGCNSALISYHFGSLNDLLIAALRESSRARLERYEGALAGVTSLRDLRRAMRELYQEDRASGHVRLLSEMMAGGLMDPALGAAVVREVQPWLTLTEASLRRVLPSALRRRFPVHEAAYGIVAMFLGMEVLGTLEGDHRRADAVVDRLSRLAPPRDRSS
jgi:AcrR family transcriptional regulator